MDDPTPAQVLVLALAAYRLTILVTADTLTAPLRDHLVLRLNQRKHGRRPHPDRVTTRNDWTARVYADPHRLAYLLDCPWCASVWIAAAVTTGWYVWGPHSLFYGAMIGAAAAGVAAILASRYRPDQ